MRRRAVRAPRRAVRGRAVEVRHRLLAVRAGVESIVFADYFEEVNRQNHYAVQERKSAAGVAVVSLAAVGVELSIGGEPGVFIDLRAPRAGSVWRQVEAGQFEAVIEDGQRRRRRPRAEDLRVAPRLLRDRGAGRARQPDRPPDAVHLVPVRPAGPAERTTGYNLPTRASGLAICSRAARSVATDGYRGHETARPRETDRPPGLRPASRCGPARKTCAAQRARVARHDLAVLRVRGALAHRPGRRVPARRSGREGLRSRAPRRPRRGRVQGRPEPVGGAATHEPPRATSRRAGPRISPSARTPARSASRSCSEPVANILNLQDMVVYNIGGMCAVHLPVADARSCGSCARAASTSSSTGPWRSSCWCWSCAILRPSQAARRSR